MPANRFAILISVTLLLAAQGFPAGNAGVLAAYEGLLTDLVVDEGDFMEVQPRHAQNIICGFARLDGQPVGVVANQPRFQAGVLDIL